MGLFGTIHGDTSHTFVQMKKSPEKKVVEQRKLGAEYLKFIKTSQKFYRTFIGKLSAAYGNIPALQRVAGKFGSEGRILMVNFGSSAKAQQSKLLVNLKHWAILDLSSWSNAVTAHSSVSEICLDTGRWSW